MHSKKKILDLKLDLLEGVTPEMAAEEIRAYREEEAVRTISKVRSALAEASGIPEDQFVVVLTGCHGHSATYGMAPVAAMHVEHSEGRASEQWVPDSEGQQQPHRMGVDFAYLNTNTGGMVELSSKGAPFLRYNKLTEAITPLGTFFGDSALFDRSMRLEWPAPQEPQKLRFRLREELSDLEVRILKLCKKKGLPAHQISGRVQMAKRDVIAVLEGLVSEGLMYRIGIEEILYETVEDF